MSIPVRLDDRLVQEAAAEAQLNRRSTPKQIEFWAEIGQLVADKIAPEELLALTQGLLNVKLERVEVTPPNSEDVWAAVEQARDNGQMAKQLQQDRVIYQACQEHPGYLEALYPDGSRAVGTFKNGRFYRVNKSAHAA